MDAINTVDSSVVKELSVFYDKAPILVSTCMLLAFVAVPLWIVCSYLGKKQVEQTKRKRNILEYKAELLASNDALSKVDADDIL